MKPPPSHARCGECGAAVKVNRDGRGRRVLVWHRKDGAACSGTGRVVDDGT